MSARPPGVVSGLPNMTPIFSRSWFVKRQIVSVRLSVPASLRSAWLISRACRPTWLSPISPSISAFGVSAATESTATTSSAPERIEQLGDLERLLAGVGLRDEEVVDVDADLARVLRVHRVLGVDEGADAAAALRLGDHVVDERRLARATPGRRSRRCGRAAARRCRARGRATSDPVEIAPIGTWAWSLIFMTEPLPNCRSICPRATSRASSRSI